MAAHAGPEHHKLLKLAVHHWRKPGVSEEDFTNWLHNVQIPPMMRLVEKHNVVHYTVVCDRALTDFFAHLN